MNIVVLDGYTLNPGDLSWATLEALGPCAFHDRTPASETLAHAAEGKIVLTNKTALPREIIERLPRLRYIGVLATGYNIVDVAAARERNQAGRVGGLGIMLMGLGVFYWGQAQKAKTGQK